MSLGESICGRGREPGPGNGAIAEPGCWTDVAAKTIRLAKNTEFLLPDLNGWIRLLKRVTPDDLGKDKKSSKNPKMMQLDDSLASVLPLETVVGSCLQALRDCSSTSFIPTSTSESSTWDSAIATLQALNLRLQRQAQQAATLNQIVRAMRNTLVLDEVLQLTVDQLHATLEVSRCLIFRPDRERQMQAGYVSEATVERAGLLGVYCDFYRHYHTELTQGLPVALHEWEKTSPEVQWAAQSCQIQAILVVPLFYQNEYIGGISLHQCDRRRVWTTEEIEFVQAIADHCAIAIHQAELYKRAQRELAERRRWEQILSHRERRFRSLLEHSNDLIEIVDAQGICQYTSPACYALLGQYPGDRLDNWIGEGLLPEEAQRLQQALTTALAAPGVSQPALEYRVQHRDGTWRTLEAMITNLVDDPAVQGLVVNARDISDRKDKAALRDREFQLRTILEHSQRSLLEKELLLQEVHHRVKNNLQVISSLLRLQTNALPSALPPALLAPSILDIFQESQNRIRAMALIHEKLYQSHELTRPPLDEYITDLVMGLLRAYGVSRQQIQLELHLEPLSLNLDTAIPCGLILNELVSNVFKHAFGEWEPGLPFPPKAQLQVRLQRQGDSLYQLQVRDNGVGLPPEIVLGQTRSLGLRLVASLTKQLQGTLELDKTGGTAFTITFPERPSNSRV